MIEAPDLAPRVDQLVRRFREIGESSMRDLPIYNTELSVEAVGFELTGDQWQGVLITPWFMNFMMLTDQSGEVDWQLMGRKTEFSLPCGNWHLICGGDEIIGPYYFLSLHSPMFDFKTQELARIEARRRLKALRTPPPAREAGTGAPDPDRRAFLRGGRATA